LSPEDRAIVVAKLDDFELTLGDVEAYLAAQPAYVQLRYNSQEKRKELVTELVRVELLSREAKRLGYDRDPEVVFAYKQQLAKRVLQSEPGEQIQASDITDADVRAYYDAHVSEFVTEAKVRASALAVDSEAKAAALRETLDALRAKEPRRFSAAFAEAAVQHSADLSLRQRQGDLGLFDQTGKRETGQPIPKAVVDAVFALQTVGELTAVIAADDHFWVATLTDRRDRVERRFEDVQNLIRTKLFRARRDEAREAFINRLEAEARVAVKAEALEKLPAPEPKAPGTEDTAILPGAKEVERLRHDAERKMLADPSAEEVPSPAGRADAGPEGAP
jgi:hypothetical protein